MWDELGDPLSFACSASRGIEVVDGPSETNGPPSTRTTPSVGNTGWVPTSSSGSLPDGSMTPSPGNPAGFRTGEKIGVAVGCTVGLLALGALGGFIILRNLGTRRAAAARRMAARKSRPSEIKAAPDGKGPRPEKRTRK